MTLLRELGRPARERGWQVEAVVRGIAGALVLVSLLLSTARSALVVAHGIRRR